MAPFLCVSPRGESLKNTYDRVVPYFKEKIFNQLESGKNILIAAHGNSLRSLVKYIENISEENILKFEIATGEPLFYEYKSGKLKELIGKKISNWYKEQGRKDLPWRLDITL